MPEQHPRSQLCFLIKEYGQSIIAEPKHLKDLLSDLAPEHCLEVNLLITALERKVTQELLHPSVLIPIDMELYRLAQQLHDVAVIEEELAYWAVESWALALNIIPQPTTHLNCEAAETVMDAPKERLQNKILIVDDDPFVRSLTTAILRDAGFVYVSDAPNGQEALKLMQKDHVNLVVCDWDMPMMSGLEFFKAVQKEPKLAGTPFIMLTCLSEINKVKEAIDAGIKAYIIKPYKPADLLKKINGMLAKRLSENKSGLP
ncbi:MAG: response regulator [Methylococcaceae bacterium]